MFPSMTATLTMPESPRYPPRNLPINTADFNNGYASHGAAAAAGKMSHLPDLDSPTSTDMPTRIKLVFVGDGSVGKTSLLVSYTTNGYPQEYLPTAFDKYSVSVNVDHHPLRVQLFDTAGQCMPGLANCVGKLMCQLGKLMFHGGWIRAGSLSNNTNRKLTEERVITWFQDDFDSLRPLCYPDTDVFLICFSVVNPTSFRNIRSKWLPEIQRYLSPSRSVPFILVGTQCDLRNDVSVLVELARYNEHPVTDAEARDLAQNIGAECYIESSALTQWNLKKVFDTAIVAALNKNSEPEREPEQANITCTQLLKRTASRTKENGKKIIPRRSWKKYCCIF